MEYDVSHFSRGALAGWAVSNGLDVQSSWGKHELNPNLIGVVALNYTVAPFACLPRRACRRRHPDLRSATTVQRP